MATLCFLIFASSCGKAPPEQQGRRGTPPPSLEQRLGGADDKLCSGNPEEALLEYLALSREHPDNDSLSARLCHAYELLGDKTGSIHAYLMAYRYGAGPQRIRRKIIDAALVIGERDKDVRAFLLALRFGGAKQDIYPKISRIYIERGDAKSQEENYFLAMKYGADEAATRRKIADVYERRADRTKDFRYYLLAYANASPKEAIVLKIVGKLKEQAQILQDSGRPRRALECLRYGLYLIRDSGEGSSSLGDARTELETKAEEIGRMGAQGQEAPAGPEDDDSSPFKIPTLTFVPTDIIKLDVDDLLKRPIVSDTLSQGAFDSLTRKSILDDRDYMEIMKFTGPIVDKYFNAAGEGQIDWSNFIAPDPLPPTPLVTLTPAIPITPFPNLITPLPAPTTELSATPAESAPSDATPVGPPPTPVPTEAGGAE